MAAARSAFFRRNKFRWKREVRGTKTAELPYIIFVFIKHPSMDCVDFEWNFTFFFLDDMTHKKVQMTFQWLAKTERHVRYGRRCANESQGVDKKFHF